VSLAMYDTLARYHCSKIRGIKDMFADFLPIDRHLFLIPPPSGSIAIEPIRGTSSAWRQAIAESVTAVAAALRCAPVFRYQAGSERAAEVGKAAAALVGVCSTFGPAHCGFLLVNPRAAALPVSKNLCQLPLAAGCLVT
jgi:hypothetical protein